MENKYYLFFMATLFSPFIWTQSTLTVYPDSIKQNLNNKYAYGTYYVPKTIEAQNDFLNNGDYLNTIRLNIIELAINSANDLNGSLAYMDNFASILQEVASKTDRVIFVFEKMPVWLSSSSDGSPAQTPGWFVLNTKPPANYTDWYNMVQQFTDRILNTYNISNAYFEIWNEPDIGSWTGTLPEFFQLFQSSYDAIKSVDSGIPVGGPASNHWANNIDYIAPNGYINNSAGELSLIANLIDSADVWNKPLDFISWHNFNLTTATHQNTIDFITNKCNNQGIVIPELFVSEWNAPSAVRDTDLHYSFAVKNTIVLKNSTIESDVIAAWQDFSSSSNEFNADFGLLSYGAIRKPFFNAIWLSAELKGRQIKSISNVLINHDASIVDDTLVVLLSNYAPPPIVEALNHTLFEGELSVIDLDNAGLVDIATNDISVIQSIYNGSTSIPNSDPINQAVNNSIPVYNYYASIENTIHNIELNLDGYNGSYSGIVYYVNDSTNNDQFTYNNLINNGFSQAAAVAEIQGNQQIVSESLSINNGNFQLALKPNCVALLKIAIPNLTAIHSMSDKKSWLKIYPNPSSDAISIKNEKQNIGLINILSAEGKLLKSYRFDSKSADIDVNFLPSGIYIIQSNKNETIRFIKE